MPPVRCLAAPCPVNWLSSSGRADTVADGRLRLIPVSCFAATHVP